MKKILNIMKKSFSLIFTLLVALATFLGIMIFGFILILFNRNLGRS